jgi:hypothetical protein
MLLWLSESSSADISVELVTFSWPGRVRKYLFTTFRFHFRSVATLFFLPQSLSREAIRLIVFLNTQTKLKQTLETTTMGVSSRSSMHKSVSDASSRHTISSSNSNSHHISRQTTLSFRKPFIPTLCVLAMIMLCITNIQYRAVKNALSRDSTLEVSLYYYSSSGGRNVSEKEERRLRLGSETVAETTALMHVEPVDTLKETIKKTIEAVLESKTLTTTEQNSKPTPLTLALTCGCPDSCDEKALRYSNGHHRCETRIKFLMHQYQIPEHEACTSAASAEDYGGNPPCDTRCVPGICKNPKEIATEEAKAKASNAEHDESHNEQSMDCGCPETCDEEGLAATNGHHVCGERIEYLMSRYHTSHLDACRAASEGENPPCSAACQPGVCQKQKKEEQPVVKNDFHVDCGCPETCDDIARDHNNGYFVCSQRLEYLITKHHVTEEEACMQSTEGENPPCTTGCQPGVCKTPDSPLTILQERELNVTEYDPNAPPKTSLLPWGNLTSMASYTPHLYSGFPNQMAVFTILILESIRQGHGQFMIESIRMKDTYGSSRYVKFEDLWDVEHWNSFYPQLPRLVNSDPVLHDQFDIKVKGPKRDKETKKWQYNNGTFIPDDVQADRPSYWGAHQLVMAGFMRYSKGRGPYVGPRKSANPADILMQKGALRPHPNLQAIIDKVLKSVSGNDGKSLEYMTVRKYTSMQRRLL